ncbi:MAG TPA: hypothetical protein VM095_03630 [Pyrinomonadaceae bacterium]|nr:hypothetical protein [Pyrinomonadaceae bacterium]
MRGATVVTSETGSQDEKENVMEKMTTENTQAVPDGLDMFETDELAKTESAGVPEYAALERMAKSGTARDAQKKVKR